MNTRIYACKTFAILTFLIILWGTFCTMYIAITGMHGSELVGAILLVVVFYGGLFLIPVASYKRGSSREKMFLNIIMNGLIEDYQSFNDSQLMEFSEYLLRIYNEKNKKIIPQEFFDGLGCFLKSRDLVENEEMFYKNQMYSAWGINFLNREVVKVNRNILYIDKLTPLNDNKVIPFAQIQKYSFVRKLFYSIICIRYTNNFSENIRVYTFNELSWRKLLTENIEGCS